MILRPPARPDGGRRSAQARCLERRADSNIGIRDARRAADAKRIRPVAREYEPVVGQWYENIDENDSFRVLSVDEDAELIKIEYLDGDIEEIDADIWAEFDLDKIDQPEGWSGEEIAAPGDDDDDDDDEWDDDEDDDDDDDDEDDDLDEETDENY
jgi:hypothetical protein